MAIYAHGGVELLDEVADLWDKQRLHHVEVAAAFRRRMELITFDMRRVGLERKAQEGALRVDTVQLPDDLFLAGYCIATVDAAGLGEIESLYVEVSCRNQGLGGHLLQRSLDWLHHAGTQRITVGVAVGNERVLPFYQRFGLLPRTLILERPP
jgi:diamine N-acetyltransferase